MSGISDANPYVGPRPIQQGERIYGRDAEIHELFHLLQGRRIAVLHSPSGAGKSSLVQAGLIPRLVQARFDVWKPIRVNLDPRALDVDDGVNRYALSAMISLEEELPEAHRRSPRELATMDLATYVRTRPRRKRRSKSNVVLLFDQFEEALTADPLATEAKRAFFRQLGELLRPARANEVDAQTYWALFIVREDYLAAFSPYRDLIPTRLANTFRLDLLGLDGAREAAVEPAASLGKRFDAVDKLIADLATVNVQEPDGTTVACKGIHVEPVQLQVVCRRLWSAMPDGATVITEEHLSAYGDVTTALSAYYDSAVEAASKGEPDVERAIRDWVDQQLISGGIRAQVRREAERSGGLDNELIDAMRESYLVRSESRAGAQWFELAHDRLVTPVHDSNVQWAREHLHPMQVRAKLWDAQGRPAHLLLSERGVENATPWMADPSSNPTELEQEYMQRSVHALEEQRASRRTKRLLTRLGAVLVILALVGSAVMLQLLLKGMEAQAASERARKELTEEQNASVSKQFAHASELETDNSLLLAVQAVRASPTDQARMRLAEALYDIRAPDWSSARGPVPPTLQAWRLQLDRPLVGGLWFREDNTLCGNVRVLDQSGVPTRHHNTVLWTLDARRQTLAEQTEVREHTSAYVVSRDGRWAARRPPPTEPRRDVILWKLLPPFQEELESDGGRAPIVTSGDLEAFVSVGTVTVRNTHDDTTVARLFHELPVNDVAFAEGGHQLVTLSAGTAHFWDVGSGATLRPPIPGPNEGWTYLRSEGQRVLLVSESPARAQLWDPSAPNATQPPLRLAEDTRRVFTSSNLWTTAVVLPGSISVWDHRTRSATEIPVDLPDTTQVHLHPQGDSLVTANVIPGPKGRTARQRVSFRMWNIETGDSVGSSLTVPHETAKPLVWSHDGFVLVETMPGSVQVWDSSTARPVSRVMRASDAQWLLGGDMALLHLRGQPTAAIPLSIDAMVKEACEIQGRNISLDAWEAIAPVGVEYECTCPDLAPPMGLLACPEPQ